MSNEHEYPINIPIYSRAYSDYVYIYLYIIDYSRLVGPCKHGLSLSFVQPLFLKRSTPAAEPRSLTAAAIVWLRNNVSHLFFVH